MERKTFLKTCCITAIGAPILGLSLHSCGSIYYAQHEVKNKQIIIPITEFIEIKKDKTKERKYVLLKLEQYSFPICIYKDKSGSYYANLLECTHNSCELNVGGGSLTCPCHGSEFTMKGKVIEGPAETNLKTFKTTHDEENIYIQFS